MERAGRVLRPGFDRPAGLLRARRLRGDPARGPRRQRLPVAVHRRNHGRRAFLPLSMSMLRLKGGEFAIGMWVVSELAHLLVNLDTLVRGETGTSLIELNVYSTETAARPHLLVRARRDDRIARDRLLAAAQSARRGHPGDPRQRAGSRINRRARRAAPSGSSSCSPPSARRSPARCGWRQR